MSGDVVLKGETMYSVIDIGSNTVRLAVYEYENGKLRHIYGRRNMSKLIEHIKEGKLQKEAMESLAVLLNEYKSESAAAGAAEVHAFATASLREMENCDEVVEYIKEKTGIEIEVITGEYEARLNFIAAKSEFGIENGLISDIGGGSSEVVIVKNGKIYEYTSLPEGSLKLYLEYVSDVFPSEEEAYKIKNRIKQLLGQSVKPDKFEVMTGIGGSIKNFAKLLRNMNIQPEDGYVKVSDIRQICEIFCSNKRFAAELINATAPDRLTTMIPGILATEAVCEYFGCEGINVCYAGVREGYVLDKIKK